MLAVVLLSTSGTRLIHESRRADAVFLACFRNFTYTAHFLAAKYPRIAVIGAGSRGEFREEDQMCCAWIAGALQQAGYSVANPETQEIIDRWRDAPSSACSLGNSAKYLRKSGQERDLDFVINRVDDLPVAFQMQGRQVVAVSTRLRLVPKPSVQLSVERATA